MKLEFPHKAPKGYSYEFEEFKKGVIAVWLRHHTIYDYNLGKSVRTVWGFYHEKSKTFSAPINAKTIGKRVDLNDTTPYTAMPLKQTPLESAFV